MEIYGKDIKTIASNASLSGSLALAGIGVEALSHNPIFIAGGCLVGYVCWKYNLGEKLIELKEQLNKEGMTITKGTKNVVVDSSLVDAGTEKLSHINGNKAALIQYGIDPVRTGNTDERGDDLLAFGYVDGTDERFDPLINDVLGKGMLLAGSQGTGKSNIIGLVAQSVGAINMPFLIIDFKGEFYTLTGVVPNGIVAGHPDAADQFPHGFYPLTSENTGDLAADLMEAPFQVILDIPSYNGDNDEVAAVIAGLLHGMMDWSRNIKRAGGEPWPCMVITDEAHNFLPETVKLSGLVMQKPSESFGALTKAYSRMGNAGRSFGYTLMMATQRLPNIAKWSIANLQTKVILAHAEKNDLNACEIETGGLVDREAIKRLAQGTGIVMGFTPDPIVVHFDRQLARHVSFTPKVEQLKQQFQGATAPRLSRVLADHSRSHIALRDTTGAFNLSSPATPTLFNRERVNALTAPCNAREQSMNIQDAIHAIHNDIHEVEEQKFTPAESAEVIKAYGQMTKATGQPPTRKSLIDYMNKNVGNHWNTGSKCYPKFQAICDEFDF